MGVGSIAKVASKLVGNLGFTAKIVTKVSTLKSQAGIYEFVGSSGKKYVGMSINVKNRITQHLASRKLPKANLKNLIVKYMPNSTKLERRIAEQRRITNYGLRNLENKINSIKSSNWKKYGV